MGDQNEYAAFRWVLTNGSAIDVLARLCFLVLINKSLYYDT